MQGQYLEVRCLRTIAGEHVAHLRIRAERVGYGGAGPAVEKAGAEYYVWLARTTTGFKVLGRRRSDDFEPINTAELESGLKTLRNVFRSHDVGAWTKALLTAPEFARVELLRHISWRRWEKSVAIPSLASMPEASRSQLAQAVLVALSQSTGPARATAHRAASALLEWATPDNRTRLKVIARTDLESKDVAIWSAALRTLSVAHPQEAIRHALRAMESANPKIRIGALKSIRVCLRDPGVRSPRIIPVLAKALDHQATRRDASRALRVATDGEHRTPAQWKRWCMDRGHSPTTRADKERK